MVLVGVPFIVFRASRGPAVLEGTGLANERRMSTYTRSQRVDPQTPAEPRAVGGWTLARLGVAAGAPSVAFALTNDTIGAELGAPLVIAGLWAWTTVAYILGGMFAWWRRPGSRIGPLMIIS